MPLFLLKEHDLVDEDVLDVAPIAIEFVGYLFFAVALNQKRSYHPYGEECPIHF
jgi:hypothetical protein